MYIYTEICHFYYACHKFSICVAWGHTPWGGNNLLNIYRFDTNLSYIVKRFIILAFTFYCCNGCKFLSFMIRGFITDWHLFKYLIWNDSAWLRWRTSLVWAFTRTICECFISYSSKKENKEKWWMCVKTW